VATLLSGSAVAIHADTAAVRSRDGVVHIIERNLGGPNAWGEIRSVTASDPADVAGFRADAAIHGDTLVVAASPQPGVTQGAVYVFERNRGGPDAWGQVARLTAGSGPHDFVDFGGSVAISGDTLIVGGRLRDFPSFPGEWKFSVAAWVYERHQGGTNAWGLVRTIDLDVPFHDEDFGWFASVSIDADTAVVASTSRSSMSAKLASPMS
jgi:hypothetical protein